MPKGPQGQKRPADVIGAAVMVAKIATGELAESDAVSPEKAKAGRAGAKKRAETLTSAQRRQIAKKAAAARWGNKTP
jgi:hypothetical protein